MKRDYAIYDVFTSTALAGNPLAVVFDGAGLSDDAMQAITREFNLSETVFVLPAENSAHTARIRIFTPGRELPFAGHPTVGTAIALAERQPAGADVDLVSVLEEGVGPVRCVVRRESNAPVFAEFDLPRQSQQLPVDLEPGAIADSLLISPADLGFENHTLSVWSAGVPFVMVPVRNLGVAERIKFDPSRWSQEVGRAGDGHLAAYVYCRGGVDHRASFHARMFAPDMGIGEDPATGAAAAAISGAIRHFDALSDGHHSLMIEQGVEMGRPSYIHLHLSIDAGTITGARIGGSAIRVASGQLEL